MPPLVVKLHKAQSDFRHSPALYRGFVGGRGSGKTWVGAYDLIRRAKRGRTYLVGSPTGVVMGDTTYPTFKARAVEMGVWDASRVRVSPYPTVELTTGATVRFRTAEDPERMRGPNLSGAWLDEASLMHQDAFTISIAALREEGEQGWLSATFTPKGPFHWTYDTFARGRPDTALFRSRTGENPFNPPGFEATLAKQYGPTYARQELGGEFVETEGAEWPAAWFPEEHFAPWWPADGLQLRVVALDPSKGKKTDEGDYSAFVALARDRAGRLWVEADIARRPTTQIVADGCRLFARFAAETGGPLDGFGCEADQFQELLADQFVTATRAQAVPVPLYKMLTGGVPKEVRIRRLTPYLSQGLFRWRDTPGTRLLVQQLQTFPVGDHDDGPDALEYALRLAIRLWNGKRGR